MGSGLEVRIWCVSLTWWQPLRLLLSFQHCHGLCRHLLDNPCRHLFCKTQRDKKNKKTQCVTLLKPSKSEITKTPGKRKPISKSSELRKRTSFNALSVSVKHLEAKGCEGRFSPVYLLVAKHLVQGMNLEQQYWLFFGGQFYTSLHQHQ